MLDLCAIDRIEHNIMAHPILAAVLDISGEPNFSACDIAMQGLTHMTLNVVRSVTAGVVGHSVTLSRDVQTPAR